MISLRQLEVLRAVLRAGTVTEAAEVLHISQPAVSRMLRHMEDQLGLKLFERTKGRLRATPEVRALYPEIEKLFSSVDVIQRAAEDLREMRSGRIVLASISSLGMTLVPWTLARFREICPGISVTVETALNHQVATLVSEQQVDLGLAFEPPEDPSIEMREVCRTDVVCVLPRGHALEERSSIHPSDLTGHALVSFSRTLPIGRVIDDAFNAVGERRRIAVEVGHSFAACALVASGVGLALVDSLSVRGNLFPTLVQRPFRPCAELSAKLLIGRYHLLSRPAKIFVSELQHASASLNTPSIYR